MENGDDKANIIIRCPRCGGEMERGTVRTGGSRGGPIQVLWGPPNWGLWGLGVGERIGSGLMKVDFVAFRCLKCKVIVVYYGEEPQITT